MRPLYIFDLDGTLALIDHRRNFVEAPPCNACGDRQESSDPPCKRCGFTGKDPDFKPDWKGFYKACVHDMPNFPVIETMKLLSSIGAEIWIFSGRSDEVELETKDWLVANAPFYDRLQMRAKDDFTHDDVLKMRWVGMLKQEDRDRLVAVFDDRDKVVKMWRRNGIACFQVAPGNF